MSDIEDDQYISKTQLKQESSENKKLGEEIVLLSPTNLAKIQMDEELEEAILLARKINRKKDGYRRQLQFIGKLLRNRDVAPIEEALSRLKAHHIESNNRFHYIETLRDSIIEGADDAIQSAIEAHPTLSRQTLRQYLRLVLKEKEKNAPPKQYRALFQYLKAELGEES